MLKRLILGAVFWGALHSMAQAQVTCNDPCPGDGSFDGANCLIMGPQNGGEGFIYNNSMYISSLTQDGSDCQAGTNWDGANCRIGPVPPNRNPFIYSDSVYLARVCDLPTGPDLYFNINRLKLKVDKDGNNRDRVRVVGQLYENDCSSIHSTYGGSTNLAKVKNKDTDKWITATFGANQFGFPAPHISPNQSVELIFYEKDSCLFSSNCSGSQTTVCGNDLHFRSRSNPYGSIVIPYHLLSNPVVHTRDLGEIVIEIEPQNP